MDFVVTAYLLILLVSGVIGIVLMTMRLLRADAPIPPLIKRSILREGAHFTTGAIGLYLFVNDYISPVSALIYSGAILLLLEYPLATLFRSPGDRNS